MGRYGPAPETAPPPPPPTDDGGLTRWSLRRKVLAVMASAGMVAAFVFNFLSPTSTGFKKDETTTVPSTAVPSAVVTLPATLSTAPPTSVVPTTPTSAR